MTGLYTPDLARYGDGPQLYRDVYTVTMRLAGRAPEEVLLRVREHLRSGEVAQAIGELVALSISYEARLPAAGLRVIPEETFDPAQWVANAPALTNEFALQPFTFAPLAADAMAFAGERVLSVLDLSNGVPDLPPEVQYKLFGEFSDPVTPGFTATDGVVGVWRAWRYGPEGQPPCLVYVAELDANADAVAFIDDARYAIKRTGEAHYQVEAYFSGAEVPDYLGHVRDNGVLLWAREQGTVQAAAAGVGGVEVDGTGYWTDGRALWQGPGSGDPSTVDGVGLFRARLTLRRAGLLR